NGAISRRTFIQDGTPDKCAGARIIVQNSNKWTKPQTGDGISPAAASVECIAPNCTEEEAETMCAALNTRLYPSLVTDDELHAFIEHVRLLGEQLFDQRCLSGTSAGKTLEVSAKKELSRMMQTHRALKGINPDGGSFVQAECSGAVVDRGAVNVL